MESRSSSETVTVRYPYIVSSIWTSAMRFAASCIKGVSSRRRNLIPLNAPFSFICDFSSLTALSSSSVGGIVEPLLVGSPWVLARERLYWGGAGRHRVELGYMGWGYTSLMPRPHPQQERVWWCLANPSGFINIDYFLGRISLHCRKHNCSATPKSLAQLQQAMNF